MVTFLAAHASGKTVTAIAMERHYAYSTVQNTLAEAKDRLHASTLAAACIRAYDMGYLTGPTGPDLEVFPA